MQPIPTLDHVVVNLRDQIDDGQDTYRRLGFTLTPRGLHSLGSINHLAIFGTDYLELIAAHPGDAQQAEILQAPIGLNGLVFGTENASQTYAELLDAGVAVETPLKLSRPVEVSEGHREAAFRVVRLSPGTTAIGRVYFCQHLTRDLVWRDEWRHHPNGTIGVARAVIAASSPATAGALFTRMFGADAVRPVSGGFSLAVGLARFDIVTPSELARQFGDAAPAAEGRREYMAALTLRTRSLDHAANALAAGNINAVQEADRVLVPAAAAFGVALEFRA
jgi:hypothetical protein